MLSDPLARFAEDPGRYRKTPGHKVIRSFARTMRGPRAEPREVCAGRLAHRPNPPLTWGVGSQSAGRVGTVAETAGLPEVDHAMNDETEEPWPFPS